MVLVLVLRLFSGGSEVLEASLLSLLINCLTDDAVVKRWWLLQANGFMLTRANANLCVLTLMDMQTLMDMLTLMDVLTRHSCLLCSIK